MRSHTSFFVKGKSEMNRLRYYLFCCLIFISSGCKTTSQTDGSFLNTANIDSLSPAKKLAELAKRSIDGWTPADIRKHMIKHYLILRLVDKNGTWKSPKLEAISQNLLPDLNKYEVEMFIDKMASLAEKNPYLMDFMTKVDSEEIPDLEEKIRIEGKTVISDVIAFALVMEQMAIAMREDWQILDTCSKIWQTERKKANIAQHMILFEHAKLHSVEYCMNQILKYNRSGKVSPHFLKLMLPVNILEAIMEDMHQGLYDNARAGWTLTVNRPGIGCIDEKNGCPARWSDDGKAILVSMPQPLQWADLYQVWNLAFVTNYPNFPYLFVKLSIPQVAGYQSSPEEYIYNRGLSLYTFIHYELLDRVDRRANGDKEVNWRDKTFSKLFGATNKASAKKYEEQLKQKSPQWNKKLESFDDKFEEVKKSTE